MRGAIALVLLVGCSFEHGALRGDAGGGDDGPGSADAMVDGSVTVQADARQCWSVPGVSVNVCLDAPLSGTRTFSADTNIDTNPITSTPMCDAVKAGSTDVCVIAANTITVSSGRTLSASGSRPLVLIATTITIEGTIDVASHVRGRQGPASDLAGCDNGTNANTSQGGGGQGGSFGGKGGDGGNEDGANASRGIAGNALTNVTTLRGGCPGGHGGRTSFSLGHGGGALLLVADSIAISSTGAVNASGASAEHGIPTDQGGGGGGAGGMIAIAAPTISLDPSGAIFANGGHGGGGAGNNTNGGDGTDPTSPTSGGGGGAGGDSAGDGAQGFPATARNGGNGTNNNDGGGGGGGGAGIIHLYPSVVTGTNVSPAPTP